jgi:hypothetical protein
MRWRQPIAPILGLALLVGSIHGWRRHMEAGALRQSIEGRAERLEGIRSRIGELEARQETMRTEWSTLRLARARAIAQAVDLAEQLAKAGSNRDWGRPPDSLPDWNPASPFIWIPKDQLALLPVEAMASDGSLVPEIAAVLTVPSDQLLMLNQALVATVSAMRVAESENARVVPDHLPGIAEREGEKITLRVDPIPEIAAAHKARYQQALVDALGSQRAGFLLETSQFWLAQTFNDQGTEGRVVSVLRSPDGSYSLSMQTGGSQWMSVGGSRVIDNYIPSHFRPLLGAFLKSDRMKENEGVP